MSFGNIVDSIRESVDKDLSSRLYEDQQFKGAGPKELKARGYTGKQYTVWIGDMLDGAFRTKEMAIKYAKEYAKKHKNVRAYEIPSTQNAFDCRNSVRLFPKLPEIVAEAEHFKGASDKEARQRGWIPPAEQKKLYFRQGIEAVRDQPLYRDADHNVYTSGDIRRMLFVNDIEKYKPLKGLYAISKDSYQDMIRVYDVHGNILDSFLIDDIINTYQESMPQRSFDNDPHGRFRR